MGVGKGAQYWLSDEGWARYQEMDRERQKARQSRKVGPRPVYVDPAEPVERIVERMADEVPRHDAVLFVGGWKLIVGSLDTPLFDAYEESTSAADRAVQEWFPVHEIMSAAFGDNWMNELRGGQRDKEIGGVRKAVDNWLREVEETLP